MTQDEANHYVILRDEGETVEIKECSKDSEFRINTEDGEFCVELRNTKSKMNLGGKIYREEDITVLLNRPIWIMRRGGETNLRGGETNLMWTFNRPSSAAAFMWGRGSKFYTLFIGKKIYPWLEGDGNIDHLRTHIEDLMNMEAAFFDNESCTKAVKEDRIEKNKWKAKRVPE